MLEYLKNKRILVIAAHPDDELLGCGATMHKLIHDNNCSIRAVILGEGITSRSNDRDVEKWQVELEKHRANIHKAANHIGYESVGIYNLPDNRFDSIALLDLIKIIEKEKELYQPEIIFTHHGGDLNIDHQRTFEAVVTAARPLPDEIVKCIVTFETPSATEWQAPNHPAKFSPNCFLEISKSDLKAKIDGMESYIYERREYPHPRSPKALRVIAQRNGAIVGQKMCEAFEIVRIND